ncbi:MAG: hypothetical protein Q7T03_03655 [Deltaproteobacteria bacterium]|nr:hypothetical protein [Deltaproteobacteria bacterium]
MRGQHTSKPWKHNKNEIYGNDGRDFIAEVFDESRDYPWNRALIVTAPDLLQACKDAYVYIDRILDKMGGDNGGKTLLQLIGKAIAKAEGK